MSINIFFPLALLCALTSCQNYEKANTIARTGVVFSTSWENGIDPRLQRETISSQATKVVYSNNNILPRSLEVTIRRSDNYAKIDNGAPRAELSFATITRFVRGGDYIINWQTYIPKDYQIDRKQPEVISQIHQGTASGYPTFALFISETGRYGVRVRAGEGRGTEGSQFGDVERDKGRVVDWQMHYIPDDIGKYSLVDLQKDGKDMFKIVGVPNAYPSDDGAYFKIGIYKSEWQKKPTDVESRTLYYGKISIMRIN
jgi:hypothetical protein